MTHETFPLMFDIYAVTLQDVFGVVARYAQTTGCIYVLEPLHGFFIRGMGNTFPRIDSELYTFDSLNQVGVHLLKSGGTLLF